MPSKYPASKAISSSKMGSDRSSGDLKSWGGSWTAGTGRGEGAETGNGLARGWGFEDTGGVATAAVVKLEPREGAGLLLTTGKTLPKLGAGSGSGSGSGIGIFLRKGSLNELGSGSARGDV